MDNADEHEFGIDIRYVYIVYLFIYGIRLKLIDI